MKHKKNRSLPPAKTLRLKDNHTWTAPTGYKIFMADRGAVSFNIPTDWFLAKLEPVEIHDAKPPNDEARISMTYWRFPSGVDWTGLPLAPLLEQATQGSKMDVLERSEIIKSPRTDLEMVWVQSRFIDPVEKPCEAYSRNLVARGWDIHVLISFDFWVDDLKRCQPVWEEIMRSLQLGRTVEDPLKGITLH